jgi:Raf kinase inhibitor-like YbhB/YbcL family protein
VPASASSPHGYDRRMARPVVATTVLVVVMAACGGGETVEGPAPAAPEEIRLTSPAFEADATIPREFTCDGDDISPPLNWTGVPADARSLALLMEDPDAPDGTFVHWTLFDIAPDTTRLEAAQVPEGAREGENSFGDEGYGGPCPPEDDEPHRYVFTLYALRAEPGVDTGAPPAEVREAIADVAIARGQLIGRYGR